MNRSRHLLRVAAATALSLGLALGGATAAGAAQPVAPASASPASEAHTAVFSLLIPHAPVTFSVDGVVLGTGVTDSTGLVTFTYSSAGFAPGYYRLVADAGSPFISSTGFSVR